MVLFQNRLKCPPKKKTQIEELYVLTFVGEKKMFVDPQQKVWKDIISSGIGEAISQ